MQKALGDDESSAGVNSGERPEVRGTRGQPPALYRQEVFQSLAERRMGRPVAVMPISWGAVALFLFATCSAALILAFTLRFSNYELVRGILTPVGGEVRILSPRGGIVQAIQVADGVEVEAGDLLATVSTAVISPSGTVASDEVLAAIADQEAALQRQLNSLAESLPIEIELIEREIQALKAQQIAAIAAVDGLGDRRVLVMERVAAGNKLVSEGAISLEELRRNVEAQIILDQQLEEAKARVQDLEARLLAARARIRQLPIASVQARSRLQNDIAGLRQQSASADAARGYEIRAEVPGIVTSLQAVAGQELDPYRPLMTLLPSDHRLRAELYAPSRAIGFLDVGQSVRLQYDAYPYQRFGTGRGKISAISQNVLSPTERLSPVEVGEPVYRVRVELEDDESKDGRTPLRLQPGMSLTAQIQLDERSLAEWLLAPLLAGAQTL